MPNLIARFCLLLLALAAMGCARQRHWEITKSIDIDPAHLESLMTLARRDDLPSVGAFTITNFYHPIDRVAGVYAWPKRDVDERTAITKRIIYVDPGSRRIANTYLTTGVWRRLPDNNDLLHFRVRLTDTTKYVRRVGNDEDVVRVLTFIDRGAVSTKDIDGREPRVTLESIDSVEEKESRDGLRVFWVTANQQFDVYSLGSEGLIFLGWCIIRS